MALGVFLCILSQDGILILVVTSEDAPHIFTPKDMYIELLLLKGVKNVDSLLFCSVGTSN
eukprot:298886-Ditylum_brightwellii.AAC.1